MALTSKQNKAVIEILDYCYQSFRGNEHYSNEEIEGIKNIMVGDSDLDKIFVINEYLTTVKRPQVVAHQAELAGAKVKADNLLIAIDGQINEAIEL